MARHEEFKSVHIDIEKGIYEVNGRDVSESGHALRLEYENGVWSLTITEDTLYYASDREIKE